MQCVPALLVSWEVHHLVDQNVLLVQNVLRTEHVLIRNVWTHAQALVALMLAARL